MDGEEVFCIGDDMLASNHEIVHEAGYLLLLYVVGFFDEVALKNVFYFCKNFLRENPGKKVVFPCGKNLSRKAAGADQATDNKVSVNDCSWLFCFVHTLLDARLRRLRQCPFLPDQEEAVRFWHELLLQYEALLF